MINKLKIGFLMVVLSFAGFVGIVHSAFSAAAVTYSSNTTVTINGRAYTILAGSTATTVVVGGAGNTTSGCHRGAFGWHIHSDFRERRHLS